MVMANLCSSVDPQTVLSRYSLFHTTDLDEARDTVAKVFCPHELKVTRPHEQFDTHMHHVPIGRVSLNRLQYGATVHIDPGCLDTFVLVMMPISGVSEAACGNDRIRSTPELAAVATPTLPLRMDTHAGCDQLMVRIDRRLVERHCMQHLGHDLDRPIEFLLGMDFTANHTECWQRLMAYLLGEAGGEGSALTSPLIKAQIEQMVVGTLLFAQPHTYSEELRRPVPAIAPYYVKRAEDYIHSHAEQPLTIVELASHAGVSTRALFAGFQDFRGISPMAYLKAVRLQRVHEELLASSSVTATVTNVAMRWGFNHLGHFTTDYKRRFGESPSETLRRFGGNSETL